MIIALFSIFFSFALAAPFVLLDFGEAVKWVLVEARDFHLGSDNLGTLGNLFFYIKGSFNEHFGGIFIELLSLLGIFFLFGKIKKLNLKHLVLFSFPIIYLMAIIKLSLHWHRWTIPILPFLSILAAIGIVELIGSLKIRKIREELFIYPALFLILIPPAQNIIRHDYTISRKDTRTIAKEWIEDNLPDNSIIAYEHYAPHLHVNKRKNFKLINTDWNLIISKPLSFYIYKNVDYIIITDSFKKRYYKEPDRYKKQVDRYETLDEKCKRVKTFTPQCYQPGPEIIIYSGCSP